MRTIFLEQLFNLAQADPNLYLLVGDVGFSVIEKFQQTFPTRCINTGVAEQNMIGVAAGLAMAGKNVYAYSFIPFVIMRCYEQIRDDLCYQQLPVKLVGVGGGLSYGPMGVTHHALEDIALTRALPEMTVIAPGNKYETAQLVPQMNELKGPAFLRLSNGNELVTYPTGAEVALGKACEIVSNFQYCIVATGNALDLGWQVCKHLESLGFGIGLVSMPTIKPLDENYFLTRNFQAIFTVEENFINGGLGEAIARMLCEKIDRKIVFHAFGIDDFYFHEAGSRDYLKEKAGLSVEKIVEVIMGKINRMRTNPSTGSGRAHESHIPVP